jgi:hypothetical protein
MNLKNLGAHKNEIQLGDEFNTRVLISYETPVAYCQTYDGSVHFFKTEKKWSNTTSKHINQWFNLFSGINESVKVLTVPQSSLDLLLSTLDKPMSGVK